MSLTVSQTYDSTYNKALKYKIEILDPYEDEILYTSNGFNIPASDINVQNINVNQAQWETWNGDIKIDDSRFHNVDPAKLDNGCVMKIAFGKTIGELQNAFYGIIDYTGPIRSNTEKLQFEVFAKGFGVITNYTFVDFQRVPPPETLKEATVISNPAIIPFYAKNLFKELFNDVNIMPLLDYTLEQRFGKDFSIEGISDIVNDFIPGIKAPMVTAAQIANIIARMSGAIWYVDQNKTLQFRYPFGDNSGHIIKDYPEPLDQGDWTAYIAPSSTFGYYDSSRPEDGFTNQIFAIAEKVDMLGIQAKTVSFQNLYNKDLGTAVYPGASKLKNMVFYMSKTGPGTDHPNPEVAKVHGFVVTDRDFSPTGDLIATFTINVKDISETPGPINKISRPEFDNIVPDKLYWIVLQEIGSGDNNTVRVWNDDDRTTPSTIIRPRYNAIRILKNGRSDGDPYSRANWFVSRSGPEMALSFATTENIVVEASDYASITKWTPNRPVQSRISIPALKSVQATQSYLDLLVTQTAQKPRFYPSMVVSIPNRLIESGTELQVASDLVKGLEFENNVIATVNAVTYNLDVNDFAIGSKFCTVQLKGWVSPI